MSNDELLDLVDENDEVIGTIWRSQYDRLISEKLGFIRSADAFIQNSEGKIWVPRRTADKRIAPNGLDFSVGGHVESGDSYDLTIIREAEEEVGLKFDPKKLTKLTKLRHDELGYFQQIYLYLTDEEPVINPSDFVSAEWLRPEELLAKLDAGEEAKGNLRLSVIELMKAKR